ncbi:MAG TPA: hypothetical protein VG204_13265 [Terriglobia bacterium]|nr:hypothetical protein [Terriglobia bacterium]
MGFFDKKVYVTKSVMAGGTKIEVRQVLGTSTDSAVQAVAAATVTARRWLQLAIPLRPSWQYNQQITPLFRFFFNADASPENVNIVWAVLQNINNGLQRPFAVKISNNNPSTLGYVTGYYAACVNRDGGIYQFDAEDQVLRRQGEIHIFRGILNKGDLTTVTLVHEAGHRFANLEDFGDEGYFTEDYSGLDSYRLPWQQCMRNADSYAAFVYFLANPALVELRLSKLAKRANRAAAAANDEDLDLGSLFG